MKKNNVAIILIFTLLFMLCSCMSTRVYEKTSNEIYDNDFLVEKNTLLTLDGEWVDSSTTKYYDFSEDYSKVIEDDESISLFTFVGVGEIKGEIYEDSSGEVIYDTEEEMEVSLMEYRIMKLDGAVYEYCYGKKKLSIEGGELKKKQKRKVKSASGTTVTERVNVSGDEFMPPYEHAFKKIISVIKRENAAKSFKNSLKEEKNDGGEEISSGNFKSVTNVERVTVKSTPNKNFIVYSIIGKPFVIAGSSVWNLVKCAGYALINFGGGYNMASGKSSFNSDAKVWFLPSASKAKEKAREAKAANGISYYPEYHLPFTDNHITVEKFDRDINVKTTADGMAETITPIETFEYDNTISVSRSAKADAASTAATADLIGTVVTIPVSVGTWVTGFAAGIYGRAKGFN